MEESVSGPPQSRHFLAGGELPIFDDSIILIRSSFPKSVRIMLRLQRVLFLAGLRPYSCRQHARRIHHLALKHKLLKVPLFIFFRMYVCMHVGACMYSLRADSEMYISRRAVDRLRCARRQRNGHNRETMLSAVSCQAAESLARELCSVRVAHFDQPQGW